MSYTYPPRTASEMIEAADKNWEYAERREWERAHLPPPGDGVEKDNPAVDPRTTGIGEQV